MIREWQSGGIVTEEYRNADLYPRVPPLFSRGERRRLARRRRPGARVPPKRTVVGSLMLAGCSVEFRHSDDTPPIWEWACRRCGGRVLVVDSSHALPVSAAERHESCSPTFAARRALAGSIGFVGGFYDR